MLEIFTPYLLFISFILTVVFNLWLIRRNIHWLVIIIANILLVLIMEFLNLAEINFLNKIFDWLIYFIVNIIGELIIKLWDLIKYLISDLWEIIKDFILDIIRLI